MASTPTIDAKKKLAKLKAAATNGRQVHEPDGEDEPSALPTAPPRPKKSKAKGKVKAKPKVTGKGGSQGKKSPEEVRQGLLDRYGEEVVELYDKLRSMKDDTIAGKLVYHHTLGGDLVRLQEEENEAAAAVGKAGKVKVSSKALARALGENDSTSDESRNFFLAFPSARALGELLEVRRPNGDQIPWNMVRLLISTRVARHRDELIAKIVKEGWTVVELTHAVKGLLGARDNDATNKGGAPVKIPKSLSQAVARWDNSTSVFLNYGKVVMTDQVVAGIVASSPESDYSPDTLKAIEGIRAKHDKIRAMLDVADAALSDGYDKIRAKLDANEPAAAAEAPKPAASRKLVKGVSKVLATR